MKPSWGFEIFLSKKSNLGEVVFGEDFFHHVHITSRKGRELKEERD